MLDVRRLQVLRSVVATGSVSGAAQALGYTPSSISQQISLLQREVGVQLLEHVGRGIRPTAAARLLDQRACAVFEELSRTEQALEDYRRQRRTRLRVEYFSTAGRSLVVPAVAALTRTHPDVQVELRLQPDGDPTRRVSLGEVDLALAVTELPVPADGVTWTHLLDDPFDVVLPVGHPLGAESEVALTDLAEIPWVTHEWPLGTCSRRVLEACSAAGFTPQYRVECNDVDTAMGLVAAGLGIGVMPRLGLVRPHPDVVIRSLRRPVPTRRVHVLHGSSFHESEAAAAFVADLRAASATASGPGSHRGRPDGPGPGPEAERTRPAG